MPVNHPVLLWERASPPTRHLCIAKLFSIVKFFKNTWGVNYAVSVGCFGWRPSWNSIRKWWDCRSYVSRGPVCQRVTLCTHACMMGS